MAPATLNPDRTGLSSGGPGQKPGVVPSADGPRGRHHGRGRDGPERHGVRTSGWTDVIEGVYLQAFAAGAMLTMLADTMMPEAFKHGGRLVGLLTVLGFLVAAMISVLE